ncbi:hypothetical protein, partial [Escherichia coli]|uniref:hypothetical protein n=1 Tax=Escherichia coli TaxID=562 RepID=UPI001BFC6596
MSFVVVPMLSSSKWQVAVRPAARGRRLLIVHAPSAARQAWARQAGRHSNLWVRITDSPLRTCTIRVTVWEAGLD